MSRTNMICIDYLVARPNAVDVLAEWMFHEWIGPMGFSRDLAADYVLDRCQRDTLPMAFVALEGDCPIGMVSLIEDTLPDGETRVPGLAGLYVEPVWRLRGVGRQLCGRVVLEARRLGLDRLSVYTTDRQGFYSRLGWVKRAESVEQLGASLSMVAYMELQLDYPLKSFAKSTKSPKLLTSSATCQQV